MTNSMNRQPGQLLSPAEQLAALTAIVASLPNRPAPRHPETGCPCADCIARDMALEQRAEARAEERRWASGREADMAADRAQGRL